MVVATAVSDVRLKHRADIDGLRAVAVVPVVAFHMGLKEISGGFVGVDVFFVISGFLIGSIILSEVQARTFSIRNFYFRRFRRILPALFFLLIATTAASFAILYPTDLAQYAESLVGAVFSYANVYFFLHSGYFARTAGSQPLLHTWSLAVEEQFYIALPLALIVLRRLSALRLRLLLILLTLASLLLSIAGAFIYRAHDATFYLLPTRAWELLLGTLVGMIGAPSGRRLREVVAAVGLALITATMLLLNSKAPFPGLTAVPPCLGAAMIIWAGRGGMTATGAVLSLPPMRFIGLISYSLYLWHWPLIVLYRQAVARDLAPADWALLAVAALGLATFSWWFVERPFRSSRVRPALIFSLSGIGAVMIAAVALLTVELGGLPGRFSPQVVRIASYLAYPGEKPFYPPPCQPSGDGFDMFGAEVCLHRTPGRPAILLMGDSHASHLHYGFTQALPEADVLRASMPGCKPVIRPQEHERAHCRRMMTRIFQDYLQRRPVDLLVLSARWTPDDLGPLAETLDWAKSRGVRVAVSGPIAEYQAPLPLVVATGMRTSSPDFARRRLRAEPAETDRAVAALARSKGVPYGSSYKALCGAGDCQRLGADGMPLQFDYGHLTWEGSVLVAKGLREQGLFASVLPATPAADAPKEIEP